jgi:hypothetical protein
LDYSRTAAKANARGSFAEFRYGYHAIPTLSLLHMHIISQDFISDSLKTVCKYFLIKIYSFVFVFSRKNIGILLQLNIFLMQVKLLMIYKQMVQFVLMQLE